MYQPIVELRLIGSSGNWGILLWFFNCGGFEISQRFETERLAQREMRRLQKKLLKLPMDAKLNILRQLLNQGLFSNCEGGNPCVRSS